VGEAPASPRSTHLYGGQAVVEGVMMRGQDHWAVAVREPTDGIYVESHDIDSIAQRHPIWRKPFFRGILVLGQSLRIGVRALMVASNHATDDEEQLSSTQVGVALTIALVAFLAIFVGYLFLIGRPKEIHRVFEYHGAEHKTIAAYEHDEELVASRIDRFPKEHVRCGTNFLIIVMIVTVFVFSLFGTPPLLWRLLSRLIAIPVIAGLAYEALRLGAKYPDSLWMRALMRPGIWLQKITTQEPDAGQIEVAVASFEEVLRREEAANAGEQPV
jgi:uncharacterized protein YqhQ